MDDDSRIGIGMLQREQSRAKQSLLTQNSSIRIFYNMKIIYVLEFHASGILHQSFLPLVFHSKMQTEIPRITKAAKKPLTM